MILQTLNWSKPWEDAKGVDSLSRLESALKISDTMQAQIPELVPVSDTAKETAIVPSNTMMTMPPHPHLTFPHCPVGLTSQVPR